MFAANYNKKDGNRPYVDPRYNTTDFLKIKTALTASGYLVNAIYFSHIVEQFFGMRTFDIEFKHQLLH